MTITSQGYAGDVTAADFATMHPLIGLSRYGVESIDDLKVTAGVGRSVNVAAGYAWGCGVRDHNSASVSIALDVVPSGVRYDLIVAHRDWSANVTTLVKINGGSTAVIPTRDVLTRAGVGPDDQPLALVQVNAAGTIGTIIDLRVVGWDGGLVGFNDLTKSYMDRPGTVLGLPSGIWQMTYDTLGNPTWKNLVPAPLSWVPITHIAAAENGGGVYAFGYLPVAGGVMLRGTVQKKTGGWAVGNQIATLPAPARPATGKTVRVVVPDTVPGQLAKVLINASGQVFFDELVTTSSTAAPSWIQFDGVFIPQG